MSSNITTKDVDGACWITISRENKANALLPEDCVNIGRYVEEAVSRPETKAIIITGSGTRAFSAGMDVGAFLELDASTARAFITQLKDMLNIVRQAPVPTIAGINGGCIGGAFELALSCDLRVSVNTAVFGLPEIKLGMPSILDAALLQQYVGLSKAKEMIILGELYSAQEMDDCGLLNHLVEPGELQAVLDKLVSQVRPFTRTATATQKRMFETWQNFGIRDANEISVDVWSSIFIDDETLDVIAEYKKSNLS